VHRWLSGAVFACVSTNRRPPGGDTPDLSLASRGSIHRGLTPSSGIFSERSRECLPEIVRIHPRIETGASPAVGSRPAFLGGGDGGQGENGTTHSSISLPGFRNAPAGLPTCESCTSLFAPSSDIRNVSTGEQSSSNVPGAVPHDNGELHWRCLYGLLGAEG
jgi:hypothetical protein